MPAYVQHQRTVRPRERGFALAAVALVQLALGFALLTGLKVPISRTADVVQQLIDVALPTKPPPPPPPPLARPIAKPARASSPAPEAKPLGGSPGPQPAHAPPSVVPIVAVRPNAAPS